jgi:hypothetical protein
MSVRSFRAIRSVATPFDPMTAEASDEIVAEYRWRQRWRVRLLIALFVLPLAIAVLPTAWKDAYGLLYIAFAIVWAVLDMLLWRCPSCDYGFGTHTLSYTKCPKCGARFLADSSAV